MPSKYGKPRTVEYMGRITGLHCRLSIEGDGYGRKVQIPRPYKNFANNILGLWELPGLGEDMGACRIAAP